MKPLLRPRTRASRAMPLAAALLAATSLAAAAGRALPGNPDDAGMRGGCDEVGFTRGDYIGNRSMLALVEQFHFQPHIEMLVRRPSDGANSLGSNLDYTIKSFPNHHRALVSLIKLGEREKTDQPLGTTRTIDCYFMRALKFRADDTVVRMLYAGYLLKKERRDEALAHLRITETHARDNPMSLYSLGLMYMEVKDYDKALELAHRAAALGNPRTELREQLAAAGHWREPAGTAAEGGASAPASAASAASATTQ